MWIRIPKALVAAEMSGEVPQDSTLALAGFMSQLPMTMMEMLPQDALQFVHDALQMGRIVTEVGEIISLTEHENQVSGLVNQASESLVSDMPTQIYNLFKTTWPDHVGPDDDICDRLVGDSGDDFTLIKDVVTILEASDKPINTPPILALWWINNKDHRFIRESAEIIRSKVNDTTHIQRAIREADRKMREAEKPAVTSEHLQRLQVLKEQLRSG